MKTFGEGVGAGLIVAFVASVLVGMASHLLTAHAINDRWQKEAVGRGFAKYEVNAYGYTVWCWENGPQ